MQSLHSLFLYFSNIISLVHFIFCPICQFDSHPRKLDIHSFILCEKGSEAAFRIFQHRIIHLPDYFYKIYDTR